MSSLGPETPPAPPDLTPHIVKNSDQYSKGGHFGDVYRCWHHFDSGKQEVAVKAFRFELTTTEGDKPAKMVRRELGIWRRLQHKNIVPFLGIAYGFGKCGTMSLVSLWMPNGTLQEFLAIHDSTLDVAHRLQLLLDIANGLHYLHSFSICPIVHGDLHCTNILLDADNTARLTDFGYASLVGDILEALTYLQTSTTQPGALRWAAPEHVLPGMTLDRTTKSDIYSFGCISLQVLSGKRPWSEVQQDIHIILLMVQGQKPRWPESPAIADEHRDLIQQCWSSVEDRPSADSIITSIEIFLSTLRFQSSCGLFISPSTLPNSVTLNNSSLVPLDVVSIDWDYDLLLGHGEDQRSIEHSPQLYTLCLPTPSVQLSNPSSPSDTWYSAPCSPLRASPQTPPSRHEDSNFHSPPLSSPPRAQVSGPSHPVVHHCQWVANEEVCGEQLTWANATDHFPQFHHNVLRRSMTQSQIICMWRGCRRSIRRANFLRHVREAHLGYSRCTASRQL
ncbi:kinase-like domain-containing protein [Boletus coccyginus]|nr:kinase-like domain-containing protein [Boletus coccyginus]